ncbi:hypothetical protein ACFV4P_35855 [Kitasatospora sp. NPDC059795]
MRTDQQDELVALLRAEVDAWFSLAPESGYAAHLRAAFDVAYRMRSRSS